MQDDDDAEARRKRANRLRAQIERVKRGSRDTGDKSGEATPGEESARSSPDDAKVSPEPDAQRPASPREFIERRMRELDSETKRKTDSGKPTKA
jgi:hypothetical protein